MLLVIVKSKQNMMTSPKWRLYPQVILDEISNEAKLSKELSYHWFGKNDNGHWGVYFRACEILFKGGRYFNQSQQIANLVERLGCLVNTKIDTAHWIIRKCTCRCHRRYSNYNCVCWNQKCYDDFDGNILEFSIKVGFVPSVISMASLVFKRFGLPKDLRIYIVRTAFG